MEEYYSNKFNEGFWQFIIDDPNKDWDWLELSRNPNITWEIIRNNPEYSWDFNNINCKKIGKNKYILDNIKKISKPILEELFYDENIIEYIYNFI